MHLNCCYGGCNSDSRRSETGITFMPFPKPWRYPMIARKWLQLLARSNLTVDNIKRCTYICSKHFPVGAQLDIRANPTLEPLNDLKHIKEEDLEYKEIAGSMTDPLSTEVKSEQHSFETNDDNKNLVKKMRKYFNCDQCDYISRRKCYINIHLLKVHGVHGDGNLFKCGDCKHITHSKLSLDTHMWKAHHKGKRRKCKHCGFIALHSYQLKKHVKIVHSNGELFQCTHCEYQTNSKSNLVVHTKVIHTEQGRFKCKDCEFETHNRSELKHHTKITHGKDLFLYCEECSYKSQHTGKFLAHRKRHLKSKPVQCGDCSYSTLNKIGLYVHRMESHKTGIVGPNTTFLTHVNQFIARFGPIKALFGTFSPY